MIYRGLLGVASLLCAAMPAGAEEDGGALLIRKVSVVSPENGNARVRDVLIKDGRILRIAKNIKSPDSDIIDGKGKFLAPGLIDSHVHLGSPPGMKYDQAQANPDVADAIMAQMPKSFLFHGFTTLIDLHSGPAQTAQWNASPIRPTAHFCGGAPIIDGYPMRFLPPPLRYQFTPYFIMEPGDERGGVDASAHTPAHIAATIKQDGGICVKTHYEDGFGARNDWPTPSADLLRSVVAEAGKLGMPVILHANAKDAQQAGAEAGVGAFAHGMWTWDDHAVTAITPDIAALLDDVIAKGVATQPTFQVLYGERDLHDPDYLAQDALRDVLPQAALDWYASEDGQSFRMEMAAIPYLQKTLAEHGYEAVDAEGIARVEATVDYLVAHDGKLLFGSDTPSDLTFANPPGFNGRMEMKRWADAGISPAAFLKAATIDNARFFNLDDEIGAVEPGKRADLLLLRENPLEAISAFDSIEMVIVGGKAYERAALSARHDD